MRAVRVSLAILLGLAAIVVCALVGWWAYIYVSDHYPLPGSHLMRALGRVPFETGYPVPCMIAFAIAFHVIGATAEGIYKGRPWAPIAAIVEGILGAIGVWLLRALAIRLEDPRYVGKSAYVHMATAGAIAVTVACAVIVAGGAVLTARRPRRDPPSTHP